MKQRIYILSNTKVKIGSISFENPIWVASGTFGYGTEIPELVDVEKLGAIVTKSITLNPREGNPPPRIVETSSGMINSIGLEKIESISSDIAGYEINISCPNVKKGGMEFGVDCDMTAKLTSELRKRTKRLLIMKLSPNVSDIVSIGMSAQNEGADAVSAINTLVGMSINSNSGKSNIYTTYGGLSGPAIKPIGLALVNKLYDKLSIPIVGIGGIVSSEDVAEYLLAGSTAVQVGTANYRNPGIGENMVDSLNKWIEKSKWDSIDDMIGKVSKYN